MTIVLDEHDAADALLWAESVYEPLDDVDLVVEVADMMAVFAAQRLERIDRLRRGALRDAARYGGGVREVVERSVRLELAAALRVTEHAAGDLLVFAEALIERYPAALASLGRAGMTERHARVLVDLLDQVETGGRADLLPAAIEIAEQQPVGTFRRKLRALVDAAREESLAERHREVVQDGRVVIEQTEDGMAWMHVYAPAVELHAAFGRLTAMAKAIAEGDGETRTRDQIRADIVGDLLIGGDTAAVPAAARGIRATVTVTVPVLALLDVAGNGLPGGSAVVEGLGPIRIDRARELCGGSADWMRVLTHPETGMVLSVGRTRYRPPPQLRRLVAWRADRCMAPGCGVPASRCEIDHTVAWEHGGATALVNHAPLCTGHHTIKHHGGWRVEQAPGGGALDWTSPSGRRYTVDPERRVPVFRETSGEGMSTAPF